MAAAPPTVYLDDPDASWTFTIRSSDDTVIDWTSPAVAIDGGDYTVTGTFLGSPATTRTLMVPLTGLTAGSHNLYLRVPGGPDLSLGRVTVKARQ